MKFAVLALTALVLFTLSAVLSLWLKQLNAPAAAESTKPGKSAAADKEPHGGDHAKSRPHGTDEPPEPLSTGSRTKDEVAALKERESRLETRQSRTDLVMLDLRADREALEALTKQLANEMKLASARVNEAQGKIGELEKKQDEISRTTADLKKQQMELEGSEKKNIDKMATMYDSIPAESAARIITQMADSGRLDTAAKLMSQMKDRQSAKVFAELEPGLAAQIFEKMRTMKKPVPAPQMP